MKWLFQIKQLNKHGNVLEQSASAEGNLITILMADVEKN